MTPVSATNQPLVLKSREALLRWRAALDPRATVAFVPTMGALHAGHAELLKRARGRADHLVLSIFVNPAQFGPKEDLASYPRTLEADLAVAAQTRVDVVFAPASPTELYPEGFSTWVEETSLSEPLCGRFRPGHFRGVTTVVLKLLNLVRPNVALFGLKDAQQFFVLERMARDLDLGVSIEGVETVREPDGLALSSRNAYLTPAEREMAPLLQRTLASTAKALETFGAQTSRARVAADATRLLLEGALEALTGAGFKPQYLELLELPTFKTAETFSRDRSYLLAAAAHLGTTRLIDNIIIKGKA